MMVDENQFFKEVTRRICGNLDIEKAMSDCLAYLKEFIPMDTMLLNTYEPDIGAIRNIAQVSESPREKLYDTIPLPRDVRAKILNRTPAFKVKIVDDPEEDMMAREVARHANITDWCSLVMRLEVAEFHLGVLVITCKGKGKYTREHARLLLEVHDPFAIAMSNALKHTELMQLKDMLADDNRYLNRELMQLSGDRIIGEKAGLKWVMEQVAQVAPGESPVLLLGETGVGKEMIANAIHAASPRKDGPFIKVNCGAIPDSLLDSELFGHEKGAFTGAFERKRGLFERADNGTIFLDEIGELPPPAQVRLLRVIQHREIDRVGGVRSVRVNIRVVAATHRDLEGMIADQRFREDLWFRLNVFPILIPPLRSRPSDIPDLVHHFIRRKAGALKIPLPPSIAMGEMERLMGYPWRGNVRELENLVERALIRHKGGMLFFEDIPAVAAPYASAEQPSEDMDLNLAMAAHIRKALTMAGGKIHGPGGAAEILGINPSTLRNRMKRLEIPHGRKRPCMNGK
ncbi:MAG: sigma-54-dependent Fis family transcriptional regulator [Desulfobacteraceae bacterium]|nr:sigma-54-dependent Fis family transcriptional regulator [Desulfobacteraceae bacterium]